MNKEKKYCASPWRSLHLNFEGQIKTCCAGSPNMLGKLSDGSIESILQSPKLKEIKESIQKGVLHEEYCENCIRREDAGGRSERDWHNNLNEDFNITTANLDEHIPSLIDVRWNNTCNLACTYCTPYCRRKSKPNYQ
jgi:radical SAM protein with 4Fe4S-binding SPASM domain